MCLFFAVFAKEDDAAHYPINISLVSKVGNLRALSRIGVLVPLYGTIQDQNLLFFNGFGLYDNHDANEVNIGLGFRQLFSDSIVGVAGFYDSRKSEHRNTFSQFTLGLEYLRSCLEFRVNGYLPFSNKDYYVKKLSKYKSDFAYVKFGSKYREKALRGFDVELGSKLLRDGALSAYLAYYHFNERDVKPVHGVRFRSRYAINDYLNLDFELAKDSLRKLNYLVGIDITVAFGRSNKKYNTLLRKKMIDMVVRDIDIVTSLTRDSMPYIYGKRVIPGGEEEILSEETLGDLGFQKTPDGKSYEKKEPKFLPKAGLSIDAAINGMDNYRAALSLMGVANAADLHSLKKAYRKGSLKYHPDKHVSEESATYGRAFGVWDALYRICQAGLSKDYQTVNAIVDGELQAYKSGALLSSKVISKVFADLQNSKPANVFVPPTVPKTAYQATSPVSNPIKKPASIVSDSGERVLATKDNPLPKIPMIAKVEIYSPKKAALVFQNGFKKEVPITGILSSGGKVTNENLGNFIWMVQNSIGYKTRYDDLRKRLVLETFGKLFGGMDGSGQNPKKKRDSFLGSVTSGALTGNRAVELDTFSDDSGAIERVDSGDVREFQSQTSQHALLAATHAPHIAPPMPLNSDSGGALVAPGDLASPSVSYSDFDAARKAEEGKNRGALHQSSFSASGGQVVDMSFASSPRHGWNWSMFIGTPIRWMDSFMLWQRLHGRARPLTGNQRKYVPTMDTAVSQTFAFGRKLNSGLFGALMAARFFSFFVAETHCGRVLNDRGFAAFWKAMFGVKNSVLDGFARNVLFKADVGPGVVTGLVFLSATVGAVQGRFDWRAAAPVDQDFVDALIENVPENGSAGFWRYVRSWFPADRFNKKISAASRVLLWSQDTPVDIKWKIFSFVCQQAARGDYLALEALSLLKLLALSGNPRDMEHYDAQTRQLYTEMSRTATSTLTHTSVQITRADTPKNLLNYLLWQESTIALWEIGELGYTSKHALIAAFLKASIIGFQMYAFANLYYVWDHVTSCPNPRGQTILGPSAFASTYTQECFDANLDATGRFPGQPAETLVGTFPSYELLAQYALDCSYPLSLAGKNMAGDDVAEILDAMNETEQSVYSADIARNRIDSAEGLSRIMAKMPPTQEFLDLTGNPIGTNPGDGQLAEIPTFSQLHTITANGIVSEFASDAQKENFAKGVAAAISSAPNVVTVDVSDNYLGGAFIHIARALDGASSMRTLKMNNNDIGDGGSTAAVEALGDSAGSWDSIREIYADSNSIGADVDGAGMKVLRNGLSRKPIQTLSLRDNHFGFRGDESLRAFGEMLGSLSELTYLDLSDIRNPVSGFRPTPIGMADFGEGIRGATNLATLLFSNNQLFDEFAVTNAFMSQIKDHPSLGVFKLDNTESSSLAKLENKGDVTGAVFNNIQMPKLRVLDVSGQHVNNNVTSLANMLTGVSGQSIEELYLAGNHFGRVDVSGTEAFGHALGNTTKLKLFDISGNPFLEQLSTSVSAAIADGLSRISTLDSLYLEDSGIGIFAGASINPLLDAIAVHPGIRYLDLSLNAFSFYGSYMDRITEIVRDSLPVLETFKWSSLSVVPASNVTALNSVLPASSQIPIYLAEPQGMQNYFTNLPASTTAVDLYGKICGPDLVPFVCPTPDVMHALIDGAKTLPNLVSLNIGNNNIGAFDSIGEPELSVLEARMGELPNLQVLDVSDNDVLSADSTISRWGNVISQLPNLREFYFSDMGMSSANTPLVDAQSFGASLGNLTSLTRVDISGNVLRDRALPILEGLSGKPLSYFNGNGFLVPMSESAKVGQFLTTVSSTMEELDFAGTGFNTTDPATIGNFTTAFSNMPNLHTLSLNSGCNHGMALALRGLSSVVNVDFRFCAGNGLVADNLKEVFADLDSAREVDISSLSSLSPSEFVKTFPGLYDKANIETLAISDSEIGRDATTSTSALADLVSRLPGLRFLDISNNRLGEHGIEGLQDLALAIREHPTLESVDVSGNEETLTLHGGDGVAELYLASESKGGVTGLELESLPAVTVPWTEAAEIVRAQDSAKLRAACESQLCTGVSVADFNATEAPTGLVDSRGRSLLAYSGGAEVSTAMTLAASPALVAVGLVGAVALPYVTYKAYKGEMQEVNLQARVMSVIGFFMSMLYILTMLF